MAGRHGNGEPLRGGDGKVRIGFPDEIATLPCTWREVNVRWASRRRGRIGR